MSTVAPEHHVLYEKQINESADADLPQASVADFCCAPGHVLVEPLPPKTRIGGLVIPDRFQKKQALGWIRKAPPGSPFAAGDLVLFASGGGQEVLIESRPMLIIDDLPGTVGDIFGRWPAELFGDPVEGNQCRESQSQT